MAENDEKRPYEENCVFRIGCNGGGELFFFFFCQSHDGLLQSADIVIDILIISSLLNGDKTAPS